MSMHDLQIKFAERNDYFDGINNLCLIIDPTNYKNDLQKYPDIMNITRSEPDYQLWFDYKT